MIVNVSTKQLTELNLVCFVKEVLAVNQIPAAFLKLEITENLVIDNHKISIEVLRKLKGLGIQLCIDDFGTGYSSLSRLHEFPIDNLKIDRSFIQRMMTSSGHYATVDLIVALAHTLNLDVVAEGIETIDVLESLKELGCEFGQGYLFSRPLSASAAEQVITHNISAIAISD